jgi:hypothetical protein
MRSFKIVSFFAAAIVGVTTLVFAQGGGRGGARNYNPATEVIFNGTVDDVQHMPPTGRGPGGLHLIVRSEAGDQEVHVGPAAYVTSQHVEFAKGDAIAVTGSKVKLGGQNVVVACEIKKGDQVLTLRDAMGFPLLSGRARRSS